MSNENLTSYQGDLSGCLGGKAKISVVGGKTEITFNRRVSKDVGTAIVRTGVLNQPAKAKK